MPVQEVEELSDCDRLSKLKDEMYDFSESVHQPWVHHAIDKNIFKGVTTMLDLQNKASQQRTSIFLSGREESVCNKAAVDVDFRKYKADMDFKIGRLQTSLDDVTQRKKRRRNESGCYFPKGLLSYIRGMDLMIVRRLKIYSINWMVLSLRSIGHRKWWSVFNVNWNQFELVLIVTVSARRSPPKI